MTNSSFRAEMFHAVFTPDNATLMYNIKGVSLTTARVLLDIQVLGYGYSAYSTVIDPCSPSNSELKGVCPMPSAPIEILGNSPLPKSALKQVPNAIYYIPDLDGKVQVWINSSDTGQPLACVEADLGNGQTVHHGAIEWSLAAIVGVGLIIAAITSGLGNTNTAAHLASNTLSLFAYFQAQAYIGMTAVTMPPIVRAWTQDFAWSMGIIRVHFLQRLATWYQRATGGTPSTYLSHLATTSVRLQKRAGAQKSSSKGSDNGDLKFLTVRGIERVGFVAKIEITNIFFTGYIFFVFFVLLTALGVICFKQVCDRLVKSGIMRPERFEDLRIGWVIVLKGILFRIVLISFPQIVALSFWELTKRDSSAEVVLAITTIITVLVLLGWGAIRVQLLARRSIKLHKSPAYILYSNLEYLNKWGFLYIPFKAHHHYFIIPLLLHTFLKGLFVAFGQHHGIVQGIAFLVLELSLLIAIGVVRPYMDKKTNGFNTAIAAINFINAIILVFCTGIFSVPPLAIGVLGVFFFVLNASFALVVLILVIWALIWGITSKNPETRYPPVLDDRGSFMRSQKNLVSELDALGATARGEKIRRLDIDDVDDDINSRSTSTPRLTNKSSGAELLPRAYRTGSASGHASPFSAASIHQHRQANNNSPWQKGVGY